MPGGAVVRAAARAALAERHRWPLWLPVALGTGVACYFALPREPAPAIALLAFAVALAAFAATLRSHHAGTRALFALLAALTLGFALAKARTMLVAAPVLDRSLGPAHMSGRIDAIEMRGTGVRVVLGDLASGRFRSGEVPAKARVSIRYGTAGLAPGQWIQLVAMLMPPPGPAEPGAYDFGRAAWFDSIGAVGYAYGRPHPAEAWRALSLGERLSGLVEGLRWRMAGRIHAVLPGSIGSIAAALITGDRGGISDEDQLALRDAGLAHVLAIAGLHMALVGFGLFWAVRAILAAIPPLALAYPIKKWAAGAALCGAGFYLVISGASASAMRAFIMLAMMLIAILLDRPALSMRSVALAAAIILILQPEAITEPGFQMSFAAVASLIAVAEWAQSRRRAVHSSRLLAYLRGIALTSLIGSIATLPYAIFHFDRATHYAVLGNLLAMPVMGLVTMPAAALSVMLMPFGLEAIPLHVMGWGITVMLAAGRLVSHLPGAVSAVSAWPVGALALISLGGLWATIWQRRWRWLGLVPVLGGIVFALAARAPDLLVADDAATVAVRGDDGLLRFLRAPRDDYTAGQWLLRDGDARLAGEAIATRADGVACDASGCVARAGDGVLIAAPWRVAALAEDCARAAIVVSAVVARDCSGPRIVIDRTSAAQDGGAAIWLPDLQMETVRAWRGSRPWSAS